MTMVETRSTSCGQANASISKAAEQGKCKRHVGQGPLRNLVFLKVMPKT